MYGLLGPLTVLTATLGTIGLAVFGNRGGAVAPESEATIQVSATIRQGDADRVVTLAYPGGTLQGIPRGASQQRWPAYSHDGRHLAYLEGDRYWRLTVLPADGQPMVVADGLVGARMWAAWSADGRLAASCVTLARGRCLLLQGLDDHAGPVPGTMGARCPFWMGDTLWCFVPHGDGWILSRVDSLEGGAVPCWELPGFDPLDAVPSPGGATLAYVAIGRGEQPPRNRLFVADLANGPVREIGGSDEDNSAPAWDSGTLVFLARSGSARRLVRLAPDSTEAIVAPLSARLIGVRIVPAAKLIVGSVRREAAGGLDLVILGWDGSRLYRSEARRRELWGISVASPRGGGAP